MAPLKQSLFSLICSSFLILQIHPAQAQSDPVKPKKTADVEALLRLSERLQAREELDQAKIAELEKKYGEAMIMQVTEEGKITKLVSFDALGNPEFYETHNHNAAITTNTNDVHPGGGAGFSLSGNTIEIGEWDGGAVRSNHNELTGRVTQVDGASTLSDHSTHVAGTMIASGVQANAKGMSFEATLKAYDFTNDEAEMAAYAATANAIVSNHSYGTITGWYNDGSNWYWYGTPSISQTEDYFFGFYNYWASIWDTIATAAPYYLIVKSAGNDRNDDIAASANNAHFVWSGGGWTASTQVRAADCPTGYDCISTSGNAKNILTVGAVNDITSGYSNPSQVVTSSFSGWGPSDDGRIKPDIVGNGVSLYSSGSQSNNDYYNSSGTSMSAPNVTGSLGLIQEYYDDIHGSFMLSSALKGLAIHTANEAGSADGPDYKFGWGLLNTQGAIEHIADTNSILTWDNLNNGDSLVYNYYFDGTEPITATICWTDPAGTPTSAQLDPTTLMLVNDLDLRVRNDSSGITYMPWVLDPANPSAAATTGDNFRDNVEQVKIATPDPGYYTFTIKHKGVLANPQQVSVMISRKADPPFVCQTTTSSVSPTICQGSSFTAPSGAVYSVGGMYMDTILNAGGCDSVITINLSVSNPQVTITSSATGCAGAAPDLTANISGGNAPYSFAWSTGASSPILLGVANGSYSVTVTDANGCMSSDAIVVNATIDNVPPTVLTQNLMLYLDALGNASLTAAQVDNGSSDNCGIASMSLSQTSFNCSHTSMANQVTLTITDAAGNSASNTAMITVLDTIAPTANAQGLTVYLNASGTVSITAAQLDNGSTDACGIASISASTTTFTCNDIGASAVQFSVTDLFGNISTVGVTVNVLDTISPALIGQNQMVYLDASGSASLIANSFVSSVSDNCSSPSLSLSQTSVDCNDLGVVNITLTASDAGGNSTTVPVTVTVLDTLAPSLTASSTAVTLDANGQAVLSSNNLLSAVSDNCGIDSIAMSQSIFTCADVSPTGVPVNLSVYDGSGNMAQATVMVVVTDPEAPTVVLQPTTLFVDANGMVNVSPSMIVDSAYDNCGIDLLFATPASFDCSAAGNEVVVTVFAQDAFGNQTSESIALDVVDNLPPTVNAQAATVYLDASGNALLTPLEVENGSTDNCEVASYALSQTEFTCADEGMSSTTLTVTDIHGNSASMTVPVQVIDTIWKITGFEWNNNLPMNSSDSVRVDLVQGASYQWSANNGSITFQNVNEAVVTYNAGPNASVTVIQTAPTGCLDTATRKLKVWPLGVESAPVLGALRVYPNPAHSVLNISLDEASLKDVQLLLYNAVGQEVYKGLSRDWSGNHQESIDLSSLADGIYLLEVLSLEQRRVFQVVVQ